ncbi:hypothetical protein V8F06_013357 [Rhypophila decipiens]
MLVTQASAILAAIPMAAALSVRGLSGGPGGWGRGGGHWGGHHDGDYDHKHELEKFRIVTYDPLFALTKEYLYLDLEEDPAPADGRFFAVQTDEENKSGTFEVTKDGELEWVTPDSSDDLIASYLLTALDDIETEPVKLTFSTPATVDNVAEPLTPWKWVVDEKDYTLALEEFEGAETYYLLLCTEGDDVYYAVGVVDKLYDDCVATHFDIEGEYED